MNKEVLEEKAQLYALGALPEDEVEEFEAIIREDREVRSMVHDYQRINELDARETAGVQPPFDAYANIMAEIEGRSSGESSLETREKRGGKVVSFVSWSGWAAAACFALAFGVSIFFGGNERSAEPDIVLNNLSNPGLVAVHTPSENFGIEDRMLELAGLAEAYWFSREGIPQDQLLADSDAEISDLTGGFTVFDRRYNIGFIAVENMPQESPEKSFHVWAKSGPGSKAVRAGTLPMDDESRGLFFFDLSSLPADMDLDSVSFFVTEEDSQDPQIPSGMIVLSDA